MPVFASSQNTPQLVVTQIPNANQVPNVVQSNVSRTTPLLLRVNEAAKMLAVSRSQMYELVKKGEVPSRPIGDSKTIRIPYDALVAWMEAGTVLAGGQN